MQMAAFHMGRLSVRHPGHPWFEVYSAGYRPLADSTTLAKCLKDYHGHAEAGMTLVTGPGRGAVTTTLDGPP